MSADHFDLISVGDSTIDTYIKIHDATVECDINRKNCKICILYGSKIPVDSIAHGVAGNAANVAVGTSLLGLRSAIYTNLGDDEQGATIKNALVRSDVSDEYIKVNVGKKSNLSVVLTFQGERTIFVYHQDWHYTLPKMAGCSWVYLTSMAKTFAETNIMDEVYRFVQNEKAKLVFAPGTHQLNEGIQKFPKLLESCEILIVNLEEAKRILGLGPSEIVDNGELLSRMLLLGPKNVVVTDGREGSYATDGKRNLKMGIFPAKVVEKTGAGDAYSSGLVSALAAGLPLDEAMAWGTINAGHAIGEIGAQNGLMRREEIERHRKSMTELKAVSF